MGARILLASYGSRGDVEPMLALGTALQARGHQVVLAASRNFRPRILQLGLTFAGMPTNGRIFVASGRSKVWPAVIAGELSALFSNLVTIAAGCDLVVASILHVAAPSVAEHTGQKLMLMTVAPPYLKLLRSFDWCPELIAALNANRAKLGLRPISSVYQYLCCSTTILIAAEPALIDQRPSEKTPVTGAWVLGDEAELDPKLEAFLINGDPPIYIGFGSMMPSRPKQLLGSIIGALADGNTRIIFDQGWGRFPLVQVPSSFYRLKNVSHRALFPRIRGVIHHGGAGTTAAASFAGKPQGILPHIADQHYWAKRVKTLNIGISPCRLDQADGSTFRAMYEQLSWDAELALSAYDFAKALNPWNGTARAADLVEAAL
jgi:vancomycin aglycone glucosyltransferase